MFPVLYLPGPCVRDSLYTLVLGSTKSIRLSNIFFNLITSGLFKSNFSWLNSSTASATVIPSCLELISAISNILLFTFLFFVDKALSPGAISFTLLLSKIEVLTSLLGLNSLTPNPPSLLILLYLIPLLSVL